jgi:hypothetical protein
MTDIRADLIAPNMVNDEDKTTSEYYEEHDQPSRAIMWVLMSVGLASVGLFTFGIYSLSMIN